MNGLKTSLKIGLKMLAILSEAGSQPRTVRDMASELHQSEKYLEQLLLPLRRARLVRSLRGPHGGYLLGRVAQDITLIDITRALQGPMTFCDCPSRACGECVSPATWQALEMCLDVSMASITLSDIMHQEPRNLPQRLALGPSWVEHGLGI